MEDDRDRGGGDPACWLDRVCPECGAFVEEDDAAHRCRVQDPAPAGDADDRRYT